MKNYQLIMVLFSVLLISSCANKHKLSTSKAHNYRFNKSYKGRDIIIRNSGDNQNLKSSQKQSLVLAEPDFSGTDRLEDPVAVAEELIREHTTFYSNKSRQTPYSEGVINLLKMSEYEMDQEDQSSSGNIELKDEKKNSFSPGTAFVLGAMSFGAVYLIGLYLKGAKSASMV